MTIRSRVWLVSSALAAGTVLLGAVSLGTGYQLSQSVDAIVSDAIPSIDTIYRVQLTVKDIRSEMLNHIAADGSEGMASAERRIEALDKQFRQQLHGYEKTISDARDREMYEGHMPAYRQVQEAWPQLRELSAANRTEECFQMFRSKIRPMLDGLEKRLSDHVEMNAKQADTAAATVQSDVVTSRVGTLAALIVSLLAGGLFAWISIRRMNAALSGSARQLGHAADEVAGAVSRLSSSAQSLAQGVSEQASSLEETSASSQEINSMTQRNAANSRATLQLAAQVDERVTSANQTLGRMVNAMEEINASSSKISKIIKVIDEIAFQTNILALNAAVEAARAGEACMGFAVVADEVRNLAQRCAGAAKDTASMIEASIAKSTGGKTSLEEMREVIGSITASATQMKALLDEVFLGSQEQVRGIEQITKAITQMERVTQDSAANAEENAAGSEELGAQSASLKDIVEQLAAMVGGAPAAHPERIRH